MALVVLGGLVARELEGVLALNQRLPFSGEAFELDGFDPAAVLFALAAMLGLLVVVELLYDPTGSGVGEVEGQPEEVNEVGLEARILHGADQDAEEVRDGAGNVVARRQWSGIGFVGKGTVAFEHLARTMAPDASAGTNMRSSQEMIS